jgi:hypothetical protein
VRKETDSRPLSLLTKRQTFVFSCPVMSPRERSGCFGDTCTQAFVKGGDRRCLDR